jgi:hypothetical protein
MQVTTEAEAALKQAQEGCSSILKILDDRSE